MTITFAVADIFGIRARRKIEMYNAAAEQARYDQVMQTLKAQDARARTLIESARRMAENTPVQVKAAQETFERAKVRYEYGLTNITEVAETQRLLAQAEIDDAVARLSVWRALLAAARERVYPIARGVGIPRENPETLKIKRRQEERTDIGVRTVIDELRSVFPRHPPEVREISGDGNGCGGRHGVEC